MFRDGLILRVENKEVSNVVIEVGNKCGVTEEPVRESGGFNGVFVCGVFIDDGIVIDENAIFLVDEGRREHVGGGVISPINPGSGIVKAASFFVGEAIAPVWGRVRSCMDKIVG